MKAQSCQKKQAIKMQVGVLQGIFKDLEELRKKEANIRKIGHEIEELEWRKKYYLLFPVEEHVMHLEHLFRILRQSTPDRSQALSNLETALQKIRSLLDLSKYRSLGEFFSDAHEVLQAVEDREIHVPLAGRFGRADGPESGWWVFELTGTREKLFVKLEGSLLEDANGKIEIFWDKNRGEPSIRLFSHDAEVMAEKS